MNWQCDVYVYESVDGGWVTHMASRRRIIPPIPDIPIHRLPTFGATWDGNSIRPARYPSRAHRLAHRLSLRLWAFWHRYVHMVSMHLIPLRKINGPYDGQTFNHDSPGECAQWLGWIRQMGYNVPDYAIRELNNEQKELDDVR